MSAERPRDAASSASKIARDRSTKIARTICIYTHGTMTSHKVLTRRNVARGWKSHDTSRSRGNRYGSRIASGDTLADDFPSSPDPWDHARNSLLYLYRNLERLLRKSNSARVERPSGSSNSSDLETDGVAPLDNNFLSLATRRESSSVRGRRKRMQRREMIRGGNFRIPLRCASDTGSWSKSYGTREALPGSCPLSCERSRAEELTSLSFSLFSYRISLVSCECTALPSFSVRLRPAAPSYGEPVDRWWW